MQTNLGQKLVVVMDASILKIFTAQGIKILNNIGNYSLDSGVDHRENKHDGFKATKSGQGGYYNPHTSVKDIDLKDASKAASEHIEACFNSHPDCKEIIIVADPKMLGHIRQDLNSNLKKVIVKEISKDLTHHTTESIESLVFA